MDGKTARHCIRCNYQVLKEEATLGKLSIVVFIKRISFVKEHSADELFVYEKGNKPHLHCEMTGVRLRL